MSVQYPAANGTSLASVTPMPRHSPRSFSNPLPCSTRRTAEFLTLWSQPERDLTPLQNISIHPLSEDVGKLGTHRQGAGEHKTAPPFYVCKIGTSQLFPLPTASTPKLAKLFIIRSLWQEATHLALAVYLADDLRKLLRVGCVGSCTGAALHAHPEQLQRLDHKRCRCARHCPCHKRCRFHACTATSAPPYYTAMLGTRASHNMQGFDIT